MNKYTIITVLLLALAAIQSCKKDEGSEEDKALYNQSLPAGFSYYQNGAILSPAGNSPHGSFKLRFNATAQAALDSTGELPSGSSFPTGSILVKEVTGSQSVSLFAVMKKDPGNANAGSGWLWAEYKPDGENVISVKKKGADGSCVSCHSGNVNRDLVNTFDLHSN